MTNKFNDVHFTNEMLEAEFGKQLATGRVVLVHTEKTKNPEWVSAYFAQKREVESRGSAPSNGLSSIAKSLKGFTVAGAYIIRHIENVNVKALEANCIDVGSILDAIIGVKDSITPMTPNQKPVQDNKGEARLSGGKTFYQHTCLTTAEEYAGDSVFKIDYVPATSTVETNPAFATSKNR